MVEVEIIGLERNSVRVVLRNFMDGNIFELYYSNHTSVSNLDQSLVKVNLDKLMMNMIQVFL